jgi:small conductance mechanosensitive channel
MEDKSFLSIIFGHFVYVGFVLLAIFITQRIIDFAVKRYFNAMYKAAENKGRKVSKKRYNTLSKTLQSIASAMLWTLAIIAILAHFGVNVAVLLSGAGALGIFLGIAGKDMLMDFYVGAMVLIEDQYRVGDYIKIDSDHEGTVEDLSLRTVVMRDVDGNVHVVPHSASPSIINMTYGFSNVKIEVGVSYDSDLEKVEKVVNEVGSTLKADKKWGEKITGNIKYDRVLSFDDSQVTIRIFGKVVAGEQWVLSGEFRKRLKKAFDDNGIEIPFPQRVVRTVNDSPKSIKK